MKVGDLVKNISAVHTNPVVHEHPIKAGFFGIVIGVRQTDLNASYRASGNGDVYVDVILSVNGMSVRCGNHMAAGFEVVP